MERPHDAVLQLAVEVDQDIAARDQIEFGERRVLDQAVLREHAQVANLLDGAICIAVFGEPALEALGRKARRQLLEAPCPSDSNGVGIDVGAEDHDLGRRRLPSFASRIMMAME